MVQASWADLRGRKCGLLVMLVSGSCWICLWILICSSIFFPLLSFTVYLHFVLKEKVLQFTHYYAPHSIICIIYGVSSVLWGDTEFFLGWIYVKPAWHEKGTRPKDMSLQRYSQADFHALFIRYPHWLVIFLGTLLVNLWQDYYCNIWWFDIDTLLYPIN